jgi:putative transposase
MDTIMKRRRHTPEQAVKAKVIIEDWRIQYNTYRPHSALGRRTPAQYARKENNHNQPDHA